MLFPRPSCRPLVVGAFDLWLFVLRIQADEKQADRTGDRHNSLLLGTSRFGDLFYADSDLLGTRGNASCALCHSLCLCPRFQWAQDCGHSGWHGGWFFWIGRRPVAGSAVLASSQKGPEGRSHWRSSTLSAACRACGDGIPARNAHMDGCQAHGHARQVAELGRCTAAITACWPGSRRGPAAAVVWTGLSVCRGAVVHAAHPASPGRRSVRWARTTHRGRPLRRARRKRWPRPAGQAGRVARRWRAHVDGDGASETAGVGAVCRKRGDVRLRKQRMAWLVHPSRLPGQDTSLSLLSLCQFSPASFAAFRC